MSLLRPEPQAHWLFQIRTEDCAKCKSEYHNIDGHFKYAPEGQKLRNPGINVIEATSFLEGAVSMEMDPTGNHFADTKILIDTGALIPTGVAISEYFSLIICKEM